MKSDSKMRSFFKTVISMMIMVLLLFTVVAGCNGIPGNSTSTLTGNVEPTVVFKKDLTAELGNAYMITDFVDDVKNGTLLNGEEVVEAAALGTVDVLTKVRGENGQTVQFPFQVTVLDQTAPELTVAEKIKAICGENTDLLKKATVTDNSNGKIAVTVSGKYDLNKVGEYPIEFTATDLSDNFITVRSLLCVVASEKDKSDSEKAKPLSKKTSKPSSAKKKTEKKVFQPENVSGNSTYLAIVYREACTTVVYTRDESGKFTVPARIAVCSPGSGSNTTLGRFSMTNKYRWATLIGPCYGQYSIRFNGSILFHSVPYQASSPNTLEYWLYNRLGTKDSLGCVRLTTRDAKWMYDNCPIGTPVIVTDSPLPAGIYKPTAPHISESDWRRGWDPTDPDSHNPWGKYKPPVNKAIGKSLVSENKNTSSKNTSSVKKTTSKKSTSSKTTSSTKKNTSTGSSSKTSTSQKASSTVSKTSSSSSGSTQQTSDDSTTSSETGTSSDTTSSEKTTEQTVPTANEP